MSLFDTFKQVGSAALSSDVGKAMSTAAADRAAAEILNVTGLQPSAAPAQTAPRSVAAPAPQPAAKTAKPKWFWPSVGGAGLLGVVGLGALLKGGAE